jgi:hypothetical protein
VAPLDVQCINDPELPACTEATAKLVRHGGRHRFWDQPIPDAGETDHPTHAQNRDHGYRWRAHA